MDSEATTKHMTLHRIAFNMYEVIAPSNVHLYDDDIVIETIGMGSIIVEAIVRGKFN